jgi:uncharacterized protein
MTFPNLKNERIRILDILRGFALTGVLLANIEGFVTFALPDSEVDAMTNTIADKITEHFLQLFISGKFISIFSMLFGYGFGVLIEKITAKGINANRFFLLRMGWLLLIGLLHLCIWQGDILNVYASCGMLLLFFRKLSSGKIITLGLLFLLVGGPLVQGLKLYLLEADPPERDIILANYVAAIKDGNFIRIAENNYKTIWYIYFERWAQFRDMFETLGRFLIGYWFLKINLLNGLSSKEQLFKKVWLLALIVAIVYLSEQVFTEVLDIKFTSNSGKILEYTFTRMGILAMAIFYCCSLVLLFFKHKQLRAFLFFEYIGKMSLTNYLTQSFFYLLIFYGCGLGLLGKIHLYMILPLSLIIYFLQILFCKYWIKSYNYGPVEWIWRQLTYWKRLPIKK